ncbi:TolC family protein [Bacteroidales bacterium OttesenSCG-928-B11]|nr:TolC family protein [Bacteroidales bacterium OttesenSCG-928-E04]MDL2308453.1 TolC family protein [Bacteroidales bacterium OttesenSCG-928-C03]MDL2311318.1 TolC family protein [Bacteroidales bacterium OttesenSCG-928-B11]MDL2326044.1 TolC family protein [Bacteroidales bacterium OttesenSCG-928-A14]
MRKISILLAILISFSVANAQQQWSLDSCISYAIEHNFTVRKNMLTLESKRIELQSAKMDIAPSVSASVGESFDIGRSTSVTGVIVNNSQSSTSFGVGMNMPLFQGLRTHHNIAASKLDLQATVYDLEQTKDDIALTVTAYYLQVLLAKEALDVARKQEEISQNQVERIEKMVDYGRSSDADLYEAQASLAADQYAVTEAANNLRLSLLDLTQLLNLSGIAEFDVQEMDDLYFTQLLSQTYNMDAYLNGALTNRPALKATEQRIAMSERHIKMARSGWYPSLSFSANYGTGYYYAYQSAFIENNLPFGTQLNNNSRGMFSLSLNIPIFDRLSTYNSVKKAKLNLANYQILLEESKASITKEIEQAYANVLASREKYHSAETYLAAAKKSFAYEEKRYEAGASNIFQYNESRNRYEKAQSDLLQAKYSYLIRLKILEFYGQQ